MMARLKNMLCSEHCNKNTVVETGPMVSICRPIHIGPVISITLPW